MTKSIRVTTRRRGNGLPTIVGIFAASVGIWVVYGAFSAVFAAVFYDRPRSTVHMAKIFD
jgi:hypothetical protein